jgi:hypothetical protein
MKRIMMMLGLLLAFGICVQRAAWLLWVSGFFQPPGPAPVQFWLFSGLALFFLGALLCLPVVWFLGKKENGLPAGEKAIEEKGAGT